MKIDFKSFIINNKYNLLLLLLWLIVVILGITHHEIWRDEARPILILRNSNIISTIITDGHPFLWYLLLFPFAKTVFAAEFMQVINVIAVLIGVIFILFKSQFNNFFKFILLFSSGMLYYLPVIARNYSLVPPLLFWLAYLYKDRDKKPYQYSICLILLSQTHSLMWMFCIVLSVFFIFELVFKYFKDRKYTKFLNVFIPILMQLINFFCMINLYKICLKGNIPDTGLEFNIFDMILNFELPKLWNLIPNEILNINNQFIIYVFNILSLVILLITLRYSRKLFILLSFSYIYFIFIFTKVWSGGIPMQKIWILFTIFAFVYWIVNEGFKTKLLGIFMCLYFTILFIFPFPYEIIKNDINNNFSTAKVVANFLINNPDTLLINSDYMLNDSIIYYIQNWEYKFNKKYPFKNKAFTEDDNYDISPIDAVEQYIKNNNLNIKYLIIEAVNKNIKEYNSNYRLLFRDKYDNWEQYINDNWEQYIIYERK